MSDEVLTIKDVAAILKLAEKTVYAMANDGELPAFKVRGQWRVRRIDFERWLEQRATGAASDPGERSGNE
jgi:excisionase family DNA binding protein